jgi:hypothetical protein
VAPGVDRVIDDPESVLEHVDEDEREDPDREHRHRDAPAIAEALQAADR